LMLNTVKGIFKASSSDPSLISQHISSLLLIYSWMVLLHNQLPHHSLVCECLVLILMQELAQSGYLLHKSFAFASAKSSLMKLQALLVQCHCPVYVCWCVLWPRVSPNS
jgi:hypothetical protein